MNALTNMKVSIAPPRNGTTPAMKNAFALLNSSRR